MTFCFHYSLKLQFFVPLRCVISSVVHSLFAAKLQSRGRAIRHLVEFVAIPTSYSKQVSYCHSIAHNYISG